MFDIQFEAHRKRAEYLRARDTLFYLIKLKVKFPVGNSIKHAFFFTRKDFHGIYKTLKPSNQLQFSHNNSYNNI